ncbi:13012_t:CDS:2, partial [Funneliformis geosporum]
CQVEIVDGKKCKKTYKTDTTTGNCAIHLTNNYRITEQAKQEVNPQINQNQDIMKMFIRKTYHQESRQLELCQYFANWILCDSLPLTIIQSPNSKPSRIPISAKKTAKYLRYVIADVSNF